MSNLKFAPGENDVVSDSFSPSVLLFWLKTEIGASTMRIVTRSPNTLLGLIPLGASDSAVPLNNVANVGVETKFSMKRALFGVVFLLVGFAAGGAGYVLCLLGLSMLLNAFSATLAIQNNGGGVQVISVSVLEKGKLEALREEINQRVFADHARLRHNESMGVQQAQLVAQQQLNTHVMQSQPQVSASQVHHVEHTAPIGQVQAPQAAHPESPIA